MEKVELGKKIIRELIDSGYQAYFVGGLVRDYLLKRNINDIDIATDALPENIMELFPIVIPTGLKHGTVTVLIDKIAFEVTTFRVEREYNDYRHPNEVEFVSNLIDDLSRRDFTMNSIAMDITGMIIDPFSGVCAISEKKIETVGNPKERFIEDPLRILRAVRFVSQLSFYIDKKTWEAMVEASELMKYISVERIKQELDKIFISDSPELGIELLINSNLIKNIPGFNEFKIDTIDNKSVIKHISKTTDFSTRWFIFLYYFNKENAKLLMSSLKFSNKEKREINNIFNSFNLLKDSINKKKCIKILIDADESIYFKVIEILYIFSIIEVDIRNYWLAELLNIQKNLKVKKINDLNINGRDLIEFIGKSGGPWTKQVLNELLEQVIYKGLQNERKILLTKAKELIEVKDV